MHLLQLAPFSDPMYLGWSMTRTPHWESKPCKTKVALLDAQRALQMIAWRGGKAEQGLDLFSKKEIIKAIKDIIY